MARPHFLLCIGICVFSSKIMITHLFAFFRMHKFISICAMLAVLGGGYYAYRALFGGEEAVRYITSRVEKGTLVVSLSGSGQVSASSRVDLKPKTSGDVINIFASQGHEVSLGAVIARLDTADAERSVRDAKTALETAKLELDKLLQPAEELTVLQAKNALTQAHESKTKAEDSLTKAYEDGFNTVLNAFLNLPAVIT